MEERYPIGKFSVSGEITLQQRGQWINEIKELSAKLKEAVHGLSNEQLDLHYRDGGWTVRQVVHHLADSHMNSFIRFKLALTEENPTIKPYYEERWAELMDSSRAEVELSLSLLDLLHKRWAILLEAMSESDYKRHFVHPESGAVIKLDYNLGLYAWHGNHHVAHITSLRRKQQI
ncbi:YfiT family bacillithiol transferase [Paenibacillus sp. CAU 1782]